MAKPATAFLINPFTKTIESVQWNGDYAQIAKLIDADLFDCARFNSGGDVAFVDDEGLHKEEQAFFLIAGYPQPLAGKALVMGTDADGDSVAPSISIEELRALTQFGQPARVNGKIMWFADLECWDMA